MTGEKPETGAFQFLRCVIPTGLVDALPELLAPYGVLGSEIGDSSACGISVTIYLGTGDAADSEILSHVLVENGAQDIERGTLENDDWLASYRELTQPIEVGIGWWIDPRPERPTPIPEGRRRLFVEPRMAFGTGSHESTRAILLTLEDIEVSDRRVLDIGTGSGILALAADLMGASTVVGLDIDPDAVWVATETAKTQDWDVRVKFVLGPIACLGETEFDIVLCNMITSNFQPIIGDMCRLLDPYGIAVFSGLLGSEAESVVAWLASAGMSVVSRRDLNEWSSLIARRRPAP